MNRKGGIDLENLIPSVLLGFFLFSVILVMHGDIAGQMGKTFDTSQNGTYSMTNSLETAQQIETKVQSNGVNNANAFFPAIGSLFDVWNLIKAGITDLTHAIQNFGNLLGGNVYVSYFVVIIISLIGLSMTFVVLKALFRTSRLK